MIKFKKKRLLSLAVMMMSAGLISCASNPPLPKQPDEGERISINVKIPIEFQELS